ncbi:uncharacterized protein A1O9_08101 [Exophiala aquamarina CBS 119918]|uniref:Uncharacterized protein n=1 Tax=Exophiala aquamarina CBS 119918 TaxID=1182545 RepID=A0A072P684_9EURO|nr:uncharacterized protein A1O9_08101 [Exophiala aquamarina CBS 119918]KEF55351.1 hypothetical protein A1O9_08101 [Exophiala aquamarina CBS 119918]
MARRSNNVQGTTTSAVLAYKNPSAFFVVVDSNKGRIDAWNSDLPPFFEPRLADLIASVKVHEDHTWFWAEPHHAINHIGYCRLYNSVENFNRPEVTTLRKEARRTAKKRYPNLAFSTEIEKAIMNSEMIIIAVNTPAKIRVASRAGDLDGISGSPTRL